MKHNSDFRYDLEIGLTFETKLYELLGKKIEVKRDSWVYKSGNIAIEYESRGKPSGIAKSEADYWSFIFSGGYEDEIIVIIKSSRLKIICREYYKKGKVKSMGDNNTSKAVLIPITEILKYK